MADEIKGEGFTIIDKRRRPKESEGASAKEGESANQEGKPKEEHNIPEIDFASFIFSLSTSAYIHFGALPDPGSKKTEKNLPMAKHTIEILGILKDKTKGNLTQEEEDLLDNILYDLRMRYVKESKVK